MHLEINNLTTHTLPSKPFEKLLGEAARHEKLKDGSISLAFVGEARMRTLNKFYRGKNKVTDVLSFGEPRKHTKSVPFALPKGEEMYLGEIIICISHAARQAKKHGWTLQYELNRLFLHGLLHILGYDHEKSEKEALHMEGIEEAILKGYTKE